MSMSDDHNMSHEGLFVAVNAHIDYELAVAREYGLGVEMQAFSNPALLAEGYEEKLNTMVKRVRALGTPVGLHGAFMDTVHCSPDPEVAATARRRYFQSLDIAEAFGATYIIFHSQYNQMVRIPDYPSIYHEASLRFWPVVLEQAEKRGIPLYIENMFEVSPEPLVLLADEFDSPYLKLCLDVAHCVIHSDIGTEDWIDAFGPHLAHIHLNDSLGTLDDHLGLGQGSIDFGTVFQCLNALDGDLTYTLETGRYTRESLDYLGMAADHNPAQT